MGARRGGEVSAGGESHNADAPGIDAILRGAGTYHAQRTLGVAELNGMPVAVRAQPVEQDIRGDTEVVEKQRGLRAFMIRSEASVTAARADDDGRAVRFLLRRTVDFQPRLIVVGVAFGSGGTVRP